MSVAVIEYGYAYFKPDEALYLTVECVPCTAEVLSGVLVTHRHKALYLGAQVGEWGPEHNGSRRAPLHWIEEV